MRTSLIVVGVLGACGQPSDGVERVGVEANALGIVTVEINRTVDNDIGVRGLDANDIEIAGANIHRGIVQFTPDPDLAPPQPTAGRELSVWVGTEPPSPLTLRGMDLMTVPEIWGGAAATFTRLGVVAKVITDDAHITFTHPSGEIAFTGANCTASTFPSAGGSVSSCCEEDGTHQWIEKTSTSKLAWRELGTACSNPSGPFPCSGTECRYGPCGGWPFWTESDNTVGHVFHPDSSSVCGRDAGNTNWEPEPYISQQLYAGVSPSCPYNWCCEGTPITGSSCGCGDGVCESYENACSCPSDCGTACGGCTEACDRDHPCNAGSCVNNQCFCEI